MPLRRTDEGTGLRLGTGYEGISPLGDSSALLQLQQLAEQVQSRTSCLAAEAIDIGMVGSTQRIKRRLAAIFAADVAGYSRLMNQDEVGTLRTLTAHREIMDSLIAKHGAGSPTRLATASWPSSRASSMPCSAP